MQGAPHLAVAQIAVSRTVSCNLTDQDLLLIDMGVLGPRITTRQPVHAC